jgi:ABC-type enterochelin transport system permease subunit
LMALLSISLAMSNLAMNSHEVVICPCMPQKLHYLSTNYTMSFCGLLFRCLVVCRAVILSTSGTVKLNVFHESRKCLTLLTAGAKTGLSSLMNKLTCSLGEYGRLA